MNQTISVVVSGSKLSGKLTVRTASYGHREPRKKDWPKPGKPGRQTKLYAPVFFDVYVDGLSKGRARVSITDDSVGDKHKLEYFDGKAWRRPSHQSANAKTHTITADLTVADLTRTPISIGT